jgi:hypothetical protein
MPLNDRDFAEIRANVMREIERRRTRGVWLTAASVAFAVLAIVFVLIPRPQHTRVVETAHIQKTPPPALRGPENRGVAAATAPPSVATNTAAPVTHVAPPVARAAVASTQEPPKKHLRPEPEAPIAIASSEPMTIELQTANPDIRIIWIAK